MDRKQARLQQRAPGGLKSSNRRRLGGGRRSRLVSFTASQLDSRSMTDGIA